MPRHSWNEERSKVQIPSEAKISSWLVSPKMKDSKARRRILSFSILEEVGPSEMLTYISTHLQGIAIRLTAYVVTLFYN